MSSRLVTVHNLGVRYHSRRGMVIALDQVNLQVERGSTIGLVGESGSGKSTLVNAISGSLSRRNAEVTGTVNIADSSMLDLTSAQLRDFRLNTLGYIGQDPHAALDPTMRVGRQLRDVAAIPGRSEFGPREYTHHFGRVGLADPKGVARRYPHELSGGMAQRVVVAMALAHNPSLIIADEPTASLDSTLRTQIMDLITGLAAHTGATLIMVSHDLGAVRRYCDLTAVMYGGRIVELAATADVFANPQHPYAAALVAASPSQGTPGERLVGIPGTQQIRTNSHPGCVFADRCTYRIEKCTQETPVDRQVSGHRVACHRADELVLAGGPS